MNKKLSESAIVKTVAEQAVRRITRKVITDLQRMTQTLSGDDSELKTTWDEVCAQVQYEQFFAWGVYDDTVNAIVGGYVCDLPGHERDSIWLQTEAGWEWNCEDSASREAYPVCDDEITEYIKSEHIYSEAGRWSNARIRAYINRSCMRD